MISWRYHIVSIVAVVLAFGLGILAGSAVVDDVFVSELTANYEKALEERDVLARAGRPDLCVRDPQPFQPGPARCPTVGVRVEHDLGGVPARSACELQRSVRHAVHVPDHDVRAVAGVEQRVGSPVDPDEDRTHVADVRAERREVLAVPVAANDDENVTPRELVGQLRQTRAPEEEVPFLPHVLDRVPREALEPLVERVAGRLHVPAHGGGRLPNADAHEA